ncbi:GlcG/HbpS family heme-binding protein [Roseateles sp.]|uniref:GlcG/HbpS family heme-binding protein n=1 Tax=Roseateles sp. TaxID=1971397 RepID=UPI003BAC1B61
MRPSFTLSCTAALLALGLPGHASATTPAAPLPLTLAQATSVAAAAQACAATPMAIAVVNADGQTLLLQRGDGVGHHNLEAARRKAYTAASTRRPTLELARQAAAQPDTRNLAALPELLLLGGGHPLAEAGTVLGAIGVAGGGGPEPDDRCAAAGAQSLRTVR